MFVCVSSEINGSSFSEVLVILLYGWNFEKYEIHIFKEHTAVCHLSMFETRKLEKYVLAYVKNFNKQKPEYAMKKDLKCDSCD